jgi:hypothetical protein
MRPGSILFTTKGIPLNSLATTGYICKKIGSLFKQITAILFLMAFALQTFSKPLLMFDYFANTKAYEKNCVNKAKPTLQCKGKCQMLKKLKQEEKKDQQNPERKAENKNEVLSSKSFYPTLTVETSTQEIKFPLSTLGSTKKMSRFLLRPPIV